MKNNEGFTLVEVILCIALLGLISVTFIPAFSNYFNWMIFTKNNITKSAFVSQGEMEINLNELEDALRKGEDLQENGEYKYGITKKIDNVQLFKDEFNDVNRQYPSIYQIESSNESGRKFIAWVGDKRLPELPVPTVEAKSLKFSQGNIDLSSKFEYASLSNLILKGFSEMISNPSNSAYRHRCDWFVSKPGYIVPEFNIESDHDTELVLPRFPDDYISLPIYSEVGTTITEFHHVLENEILQKYSGRHILFTVTPYAKSLKKGYTSVSSPLYIYGPNFTTNLVVHLDASTLDLNDSSSIINGEFRVKNWKNNSPTSNINATQTTQANMPIITRLSNVPNPTLATPFQIDDEGNISVWGRALGNLDSNMSNMKISSSSNILSQNFSMFIVLRKVDSPLSPQISQSIIQGSNGSNKLWSLDWVGEPSNPRLAIVTESNKVEFISTINLGEWYLVHVNVQSNILLEATSLKKNSDHSLIASGAKSLSNNTRVIDINWNGVEIAEILIYNGNINIEDLNSVKEFLISKYNPEI